ncbi:MAG: serine/threonine protein kinase [Gemmatimonadaceae bacterium]|nr:serine/threonine protein kinase [Gemmatimonadaceae bacterium]
MLDFAHPVSANDLQKRLQAALGDEYSIERELGGGGMSRVFVANDSELGRRVVLKLFPPELAGGLNIERFRREIQLAAQLQHPHIVPVHSAGEVDGMPYYVMPFIEGESLRARLDRGEPISIAEAVRILHHVTDALAYAHDRGVVHRDIKPDNVLMSGQHAVVTDFGVAKALGHAMSHAKGGSAVTGIGFAIGTPAYMAPEQAAGDPATDHRSDIYSVGVLAYELLAGKSPFSGYAPHETLAAHLTERPKRVDVLRPGTPPALAAIIAKCLEKRPADRPQTAIEVCRDLDALTTPSGGGIRAISAARARGRWMLAAAAVAGVALLAIGVAAFRPRPALLDEHVVAVAPFRLSGGDPSIRYLREGMLDLLAAKLTGTGGPRSSDPRALLSAWRRAAGSDSADLPRDQALSVAEDLGAGQLLLGDISGTAKRLLLSASLLRVRDGRARAHATAEGPADSLPQLVDRLAAQLLAMEAGEAERLSALTSTSLPALQAYLSGQWMYRKSRFQAAADDFSRAIELDSTFALAALGLASATRWYGDPVQGQRGAAVAWANRERLSERDLAMLHVIVGPNYPGFSSTTSTLAARERYLALAPDRLDALFELGDGLFHFGPAIGVPDAHRRAADAFRRVLALDSAFSPALEHLLLLDAKAGDTASVRRLGTLYLATDSASENADGVRWRMAVSLGDSAALGDIDKRRSTLNSMTVHSIQFISQLDGVDVDRAERVARERATRDVPASMRSYELLSTHDLELNRGRPNNALAITAELARNQRVPGSELRERIRDALFWDGDTTAAAAAVAILERATAGAAPDSSPARPVYFVNVCFVQLWKLARGDAAGAGANIARLRAGATGALEGNASFMSGCAIMLDALHAASEKRADAAVYSNRLDSLMRTGPQGQLQFMGNLVVARLKEQEGDFPTALAALRRREYFMSRAAFLSTYLREEGRLASKVGDREGALAAYRHFLALRSSPERALERDTAFIRAEVRRLEGRVEG